MFYTEERHYSLQTDPVDKLSITNKKTTVVIAVAWRSLDININMHLIKSARLIIHITDIIKQKLMQQRKFI